MEQHNKYEQVLSQAVQLEHSAQINLILELAAHLHAKPEEKPAIRRSIMELQGLFKGAWAGVDAQEYVM
jgi:hypothetical protein